MAKQPAIERRERPKGPWGERVEYADIGLFAHRPRQLIVTGEQRAGAIDGLAKLVDGEVQSERIAQDEWLLSTEASFDMATVIDQLSALGVQVEPNVIYFDHSCGCGCDPCGGFGSNPFSSNPFSSNPFSSNPFSSNPFSSNPFSSNPFSSNPFSSNPFSSNPFSSNPFSSNPFSSNPFSSNPFSSNGFAATGERPSSARPAGNPGKAKYQVEAGPARVIILDTGIAFNTQLPALLNKGEHKLAAQHDRDVPDDEVMDTFLDPSSGHGTFIAGIIEQLAPGHDVHSIGVLNTLGEGDAAIIVNRIDELLSKGLIDKNTIVNMSFGSYGDIRLSAVGRAIKRIQDRDAVVVASAGNDGTCLPSYPAAFPDVVSVGAIEPAGRAHYSNYGPWVRACAPGTDIVSSFFKKFEGDISPEVEVEDFTSWAQWTGTSFAGPVVAAALVRHMDLTGDNAAAAVKAVVDGESLGRYPGLGTVVNLAVGQ